MDETTQKPAPTVTTSYDPKTNRPITSISYAPNGVDHALQRAITDLMDKLVQDRGEFSLAELGYLHINTLTYDQTTGALRLRVYFDIHLAARAKKSKVNNSTDIVPVEELNVFSGYLFYGDKADVVTYEKIMAPKTSVYRDEAGKVFLKFKDGAKFVETDVLVLNCNIPLTMASINDISLTDPNFDINIATVGKGAAKAIKAVVTSIENREVPVAITVRHDTNYNLHYDPDDAEPYLRELANRMANAKNNQHKLDDKVRKKSKKAKKAQEKRARQRGSYAKYA